MEIEKLYKSRYLLEELYLKKKLTTIQISKICKASHSTISNWLKKLNIPLRSWGERCHLANGNHCDLSQKAIKWINGELLGDGCLEYISQRSACFRYISKYLEYCEYVRDTLKMFGIEQAGKINYYIGGWSVNGVYKYTTRSYAELLTIRKKWYPEGKKIVPKDIKLTPLTCRQWYIGDGSLKHPQYGRPYIKLCTNGFTISDVNFLVGKLIDLGFKTTRQPSENVVSISPYSTKEFLSYIGECPVKCYRYKWESNIGDR